MTTYRYHNFLNTISNLVYGFGGVFVLYFSGGTPEAIVFALTLAYLMLGSSVYHHMQPAYHFSRASLDVGAMYAVMGALLAYALAWPWWGMVLVSAASTYLLQYVHARQAPPGKDHMRAKIGAFAAAIFMLVVLNPPVEWVPLGTALALFATALVIRDHYDDAATPGHMIWHILTGVGFPFLFLAIR